MAAHSRAGSPDDWRDNDFPREFLADVSEAARQYLAPINGLKITCQEAEGLIEKLMECGCITDSPPFKRDFDRLLAAVENLQQPCSNCVDLMKTTARVAESDSPDQISRYRAISTVRLDCIAKAEEFVRAYGDLSTTIQHWRNAATTLADNLGSDLKAMGTFTGVFSAGCGLDCTQLLLVVACGCGGALLLGTDPQIPRAMQFLAPGTLALMATTVGNSGSQVLINQCHRNEASGAAVRLVHLAAGRLKDQLEQFKPLRIRRSAGEN